MVASAATTTILFTDLVGSTELMQQAGDERAQRIFQAHYRLLRDAVAANGGNEVKTLGDGLMVAFNSAADAVRCAIAMQQAAGRRSAAGERLRIRVGLNTGDALRDEGDFFGTAVVIARRLCDMAEPGQIIASSVVSGLLAGRQAFAFKDLGPLRLKGIAQDVPSAEVVYEQNEPGALLAQTPFIGRMAEMRRLQAKLDAARSGHGGLVMLVGEPGIGKTRTTQEFCDWARDGGSQVIWGRCYEGEYQPPYAPFAQAICEYAEAASPEQLRADLGFGAAPIARLAPEVRQVLPDLPEAEPIEPNEERFRLLDAVSQFLIAASRRAPLVLVLDDLHWADKGTIAMLRHVARATPRNPILVLGAYRDVELDRQHPLADALSALRREVEYERLLLRGLDADEVGNLLEAIAEHDVNPALVRAISAETDGNPFFIREVLIHLVEEGKLFYEEGRWQTSASSIRDLGIPEGVRQVIGRRLSRLSPDTNRLLQAACAFSGEFKFDIAARISGLGTSEGLDALDEALDAQVLRPSGNPDTYDFTHALFRHTLYTEMNPSRQVRLHRQVAEALEAAHGAQPGQHAGEVAYQYHHSSVLPGAERGVAFALGAAEAAERAAAWDEAASFLRMALDLALPDDPSRMDLQGRLAIDLAWALRPEEAGDLALEAVRAMDAGRGSDAAVAYCELAVIALRDAGFISQSWRLARLGVELAGDRRDATWVRLKLMDMDRRAAEDPDSPGVATWTPEQEEISEVVASLPSQEIRGFVIAPESRRAAMARQRGLDGVIARVFFAGDFIGGLAMCAEMAASDERAGKIAAALADWATLSRCHIALGNLAEARTALDRSLGFAARYDAPSRQQAQLAAAQDELVLALDEGWEALAQMVPPLLEESTPENRWARAAVQAAASRTYARLGRTSEAVAFLAELQGPIDAGSAADANYLRILGDATTACWWLGRPEFTPVIERNLLAKIIGPDFRYPMQDARLALAQIAALTSRFDEARDWFARARAALDEQQARTLRAITDLDEGWMYLRWPEAGPNERARPLLEAALAEFRDIGMSGWQRRAEGLLAGL